MKLIIDIPEEKYKTIQEGMYCGMLDADLYRDIKNGIPLDNLRAEIERAADKQFQIAMGVSDLNERYAHIQMENAYRHSLNIIDKYKTESEKYKEKLSWLGKNCKDCGNEKCKKLGTLPKGYDCALWQAEGSEE